MGAAFELAEITVDHSNVDNSPVFERKVGVYASLQEAMGVQRQRGRERAQPAQRTPSTQIVYHTITERFPNMARRGQPRHGRQWVFQDGWLHGRSESWSEAPAHGWRPARCRFQPRAVVGFASRGRWTLGVVLAQPVDPRDVRTLQAQAWEEGVYLIGMPCEPGECAHEHIHESLLFAPRGRLAPALHATLVDRYRHSVPT